MYGDSWSLRCFIPFSSQSLGIRNRTTRSKVPNIRAGVLLVLCLGDLRAFPPEPRQRGPVYVTASFVDKNNLFIESLSKDEVQVLENGQVRRIEFMASDEIPVVYGLIFERALFSESQADDRSRY